MPKTLEQLREEFKQLEFSKWENEKDIIKYTMMVYDKVADYWLEIIQAEREEVRSKVEEKELKVEYDNPILEAQCTAYNQALKDVLDLLPPKG